MLCCKFRERHLYKNPNEVQVGSDAVTQNKLLRVATGKKIKSLKTNPNNIKDFSYDILLLNYFFLYMLTIH